jgi:acyl dehydratase
MIGGKENGWRRPKMAQTKGIADTIWHQGGQKPVVSNWLVIDQDRITTFGLNTNDPDRLHIDPAYAAEHGPHGKTISFGFLTMSLLTHFFHDAVISDRSGYALNYGFDRVRLPNTVAVGARLRGVFTLIGNEARGGNRELRRYGVTIEIEGEEKPALVGEWLVMWVDDGVHHSASPDVDGTPE